MAIIGTSPWLDAANVGQGLARGLGDVAIQIPQARANAQLMRQQLLAQQQQMALQAQAAPLQRSALAARAGMQQSQGGMYDARAKVYGEQAAGLHQEHQADLDTGMAAGEFMKEAMSTGGQVSPATASKLAQAMFTKVKTDPNFAKQMEQIVALGSSHLAQNPSLGAALMSGARVPMTTQVNQGATAMNTMTGEPEMVGAQKLRAGESVTAPQQVQDGQPSSLAIAATSPNKPLAQKPYNVDPLVISALHSMGPAMTGGTVDEVGSNVMRLRQMLTPTNTAAAQPQVIPDKNGKHWVYKGNMPDPRQDKNEANWELVQ